MKGNKDTIEISYNVVIVIVQIPHFFIQQQRHLLYK